MSFVFNRDGDGGIGGKHKGPGWGRKVARRGDGGGEGRLSTRELAHEREQGRRRGGGEKGAG